ncbi:MAG: cytochrome c oxidase subunit [Actinomycetota bacterium]|nr:cytochrome c oxidase subunit [Actinomycetota bacterium]
MTAVTAVASPVVFERRGRPVGWWGVVCMIMTEAMLFVGLLSSYFFLWASSPHWPQDGIEPPALGRISIFTVILLSSSVPIVVAEWANHRGRTRLTRNAMLVAFLMGAAFLVNQVFDYRELTFGWRDNAYAAIFYVTTGLHGLHVLLGLLMSLVVQAKGAAGRLARRDDISVQVFALYWHFVDGVWILVFACLYLAPHAAR